MSHTLDQVAPAFPALTDETWSDEPVLNRGLTQRQHAAIALRVPESGSDWLDAMIRTSLRDDLAAKAMQGIVSTVPHLSAVSPADVSAEAYEFADSMLAERGKS